MSDQGDPKIQTIGLKIFSITLTHPLEYVKFLIQIGHEPLPPYPSTTLFGRSKIYVLPNGFKYAKYIHGMDGLSGCYRGFTPKLGSYFLETLTGSLVTKYAHESGFIKPETDPPVIMPTNKEKVDKFKCELLFSILRRTVCVITTHPLVVISSRMMAEFIGGEQQYTGIFSSILEIYREQGLSGFFSGLVPRWIGEMATLVITSIMIFGVNTFVVQDKELHVFTTLCIQYFTSTFTYPFTVVSSCMQINNCGLIAGSPPNMPIYDNWLNCFNHLSKSGVLSRESSLFRGSSLIFRPCPASIMPYATKSF